MSKKTYKVFSVLLIVFMLLSIATNVFAAGFNPSNITGNVQNSAGANEIKRMLVIV